MAFKNSEKGEKYEGTQVQGVPEGEGEYTFEDGSKYKGQWVNGKPHGVGTITWADGTSYEGWWKEGNMHGKGKYFDKNGVLKKEGVWTDEGVSAFDITAMAVQQEEKAEPEPAEEAQAEDELPFDQAEVAPENKPETVADVV